jgi:hypothetical protein
MMLRAEIADLVDSETVIAWAKEHCASFASVEEIDVSDFTTHCDTITEFWFMDEADVLLFRLRWL